MGMEGRGAARAARDFFWGSALLQAKSLSQVLAAIHLSVLSLMSVMGGSMK